MSNKQSVDKISSFVVFSQVNSFILGIYPCNGYDQSELPSRQTLREILNRLVQTSRYS